MRILGLDISKEGIASVQLESAFGRYEIRETQEIEIFPGTNPLTQPPASFASQLLDRIAEVPDRLVTSLPMELTTFRNLQVATRDKKAIRAALEFELEDDLPFEKENLHYDSVILNSGAQGSLIHIAASKKENVKSHIELLTSNGVDPDIITTDAWAYRCLFSRIKDLPESVLLVGLEHYKTFFYFHVKNRPALYREVPFGIYTLEFHLQEKLGANATDAQKWINDIGVSGINTQVSGAILEALELLVPEFKQTELAARAQMSGNIDKIYVTGNGGLIPGFLGWLEEVTLKPVSLFKPLSLVSPNPITYSDTTEVRFSRALALAFVTLPADKLSPINFRKGIFSKTNENLNSPIELIKKPLPYLLLTLFVFFVVKSVEYKYYTSKLAETEESLKRSVKSYFGDISDSAARSYMSNIPNLKKTIEKDLTKERELAKLYTPNLNSPLIFLKNLSQKVGKDVVTDLVTFDAGSEYTDKFIENKPIHTSLTFVISNPQLLARLSELLDKNFALKKGNSETVQIEGHKSFQVTFTGTLGAGK